MMDEHTLFQLEPIKGCRLHQFAAPYNMAGGGTDVKGKLSLIVQPLRCLLAAYFDKDAYMFCV